MVHPLLSLLENRVAILDGAMGTMVQRYKLDEAAYRGERFANWTGKDLKGNNELLLLTRPSVIEEIHTMPNVTYLTKVRNREASKA